MNDAARHSSSGDSKIETAPLADLVAALPEVYQPIYGHPELSGKASRPCEDRLAQIVEIYDLLSKTLDRPLRVLDLGCAQGFFSLNLARRGAVVFGVDMLPANVAVCKALAAEQPDLKAGFGCGRIEDLIDHMPADNCDLVLGLSVFHHIVHAGGVIKARELLSALAQKATVGLFEMALRNEPPSWSRSQPKNPRDLLDGFAFIHEFSQNATHLSDIARPFYIASNHYWLLDGQMESFDRWSSEPHIFANNGSLRTRRYFFGNGKIAKIFSLENSRTREPNLKEYNQEIAFLNDPPPDLKYPQIYLCGHHERETWSVREFMKGDLLVDLIREARPYDAAAVLLDILHELVILEERGLFHDDLRLWNVLIGPDGHARLIDYGSISAEAKDCAWPYNLFLSFIIFVHEVLEGKAAAPDPLQQPLLNPQTLPEPYRSAIWDILALPQQEWRFADLYKRVRDNDAGRETALPVHPGFDIIFKAMEEHSSRR